MYEFRVYINFPFTFNPLSCVTKNDRYEKKFRFRNFAEHSIGLSYPIYTYKSSSLAFQKKKKRQRERKKNSQRSRLPDEMAIASSFRIGFQPLFPGRSLHLYSPREPLAQLVAIHLPFFPPVPGGRRSSLSFPLAGHFQPPAPGWENVLRKCERLGLSRLLHRERTGTSSMHSGQRIGRYFLPQGAGHPTITRGSIPSLQQPPGSLKPFLFFSPSLSYHASSSSYY